jgi:hypothetical protein
VKQGRALAIELKSEKGQVSAGQELWLRALGECTEVRVMVVRPRDLDALLEELR